MKKTAIYLMMLLMAMTFALNSKASTKVGTPVCWTVPAVFTPDQEVTFYYDVTDVGFRLLCKQHGADMVYTEFVSSDALIRHVKSTKEKLTIVDEERPPGVEIKSLHGEGEDLRIGLDEAFPAGDDIVPQKRNPRCERRRDRDLLRGPIGEPVLRDASTVEFCHQLVGGELGDEGELEVLHVHAVDRGERLINHRQLVDLGGARDSGIRAPVPLVELAALEEVFPLCGAVPARDGSVGVPPDQDIAEVPDDGLTDRPGRWAGKALPRARRIFAGPGPF